MENKGYIYNNIRANVYSRVIEFLEYTVWRKCEPIHLFVADYPSQDFWLFFTFLHQKIK